MERIYLILNKEGQALAQAVLESPRITEVMQLRLMDEETDINFMEVSEVQCIGLDNSSVSIRGIVTMQRKDRLVIKPGATLGAEARENLRIQTNFQSVMYPVSGYWKGQRPITGLDLSCGGVAFFSAQSLENGEIVEIVLPVTDSPMLLHTRILRELPSKENTPLYAGRFVDLCQDEEFLIRKAVFSIQVSRPRRKKMEDLDK